MTKWKKRAVRLLSPLPACLIAFATPQAHSTESYPSKPISLVLPFAAGNGADISLRNIATRLSQALGQQVIVQNRPGAGGVGAINQVAAMPADGYTLLLAGVGMPISQALFKPSPYDMMASFVPIVTTIAADVVIVAKAGSQYKSLDDFIRVAGEKKKNLMVGISLLGSSQHMAAELFKLRTNVDYTIVPYRTAAFLTSALIAGDIDIGFEFTSPILPMIQDDRLHVLGISSPERLPLLKDVPTVMESGVSDYTVQAWGMLVAPKGTPDNIVNLLNTEIRKVLRDPELIQQIESGGTQVIGDTPEQAAHLMQSEIERWKDLVSAANLSVQ